MNLGRRAAADAWSSRRASASTSIPSLSCGTSMNVAPKLRMIGMALKYVGDVTTTASPSSSMSRHTSSSACLAPLVTSTFDAVTGDPFAQLGQARSRRVLQGFGAESREGTAGLAREIGQHARERVSGIECDLVVRVGRRHDGRQLRGAPRERGRWHPPKAPWSERFYLYGQNVALICMDIKGRVKSPGKRRPTGRLRGSGKREEGLGRSRGG